MAPPTTSPSALLTQPPRLLDAEPDSTSRRRLDPDAYRDLRLDRLLERLTAGRAEYELDGWFTTLVSEREVAYRHEVFIDLESPALREGLTLFSRSLQRIRRILTMAARLSYDLEQRRWFLTAAGEHATSVRALRDVLQSTSPGSAALRGLSAWLDTYVDSAGFQALAADAENVTERLDAIRYRVRLHGDWIEVRPTDPDEPELASRVLATFERFRQGAAQDYLQDIRDPGAMDHVEAAVASFVARLNPGAFAALEEFCRRHGSFVPQELTRVERELQFYLAYLELREATAAAGVTWSLPEITGGAGLAIRSGLDIALLLSGSATVPNDCELGAQERLVVVTGPNQGGKTTFARMLGQVHVLAATGAPVPAASVTVPLADQVFTIFERGANLDDLRGHLHDDLVRAHELLGRLTGRSLVLLNEVYSSTSPDDALALARDLLTRLEESGARTACVTFLDELSDRSPATVSMVAGVDPDDATLRTYRVERRPADGLAYARALARRHGLTPGELHRRLVR